MQTARVNRIDRSRAPHALIKLWKVEPLASDWQNEALAF
jgi:hypothetical protein